MWHPQLAPRRPSIGLGAFSDYAGNAQFKASWDEIAKQLAAEGVGPQDIGYAAAQTMFADAFGNLIGKGIDASVALPSAQSLTINAQTIGGAVAQVSGLVQALQGGNTKQVFQAVTGTMVGLFGAASFAFPPAALGAAILAGAAGLLGQFLGAPSSNVAGCPYTSCNPTPSWAVGCVCVWQSGSQTIAPGSAAWRSFPDPNDPADAAWYVPNGRGVGDWKGATFGGDASPYARGTRPIDIAFPELAQIERDAQSGGDLGPFLQAFMAAWKANREYSLNGLNPQPDSTVLIHTARIWNKSHSDSSGVDIPYDPNANNIYSPNPYVQSLVQDAVRANPPDVLNGFAVHVNTGPGKVVFVLNPKLVRFATGGAAPKAATKPAASTTSTVLKGTAIAAGATAAGIGIYAWLTKQAYGVAAGKVWDQTGGRVVKQAKAALRGRTV
jgi:hypothetical protein